MKSKLKKVIREQFARIAKEIDPSFIDDPAYLNDPQLCLARRRVTSGQWQFVAISFSPTADRFYLEVAVADQATYPINAFPRGPNDPLDGGKLRFRASRLWAEPNKSGGWLIQKSGDEPACDIVFPPEGVFETPEAAMSDVKERYKNWILPYLNAAGATN